MMKFIHKLTIVLALGGICGLAACSDDDQGFLKRNLREMSFPYVESSDTFTIRATGDWQISDAPDSREWTNAYGWVHVDQLSGKGDPGTYQKVTVTCDQNTSEERSATIYLHGCGEENVAIAIRQDNGIFEWKPFDNGQQFDVSGMLKLNAEAGAKLRIPYIKALGTEKYTVTVTQTGGDGITAASGSYSISTAGNGYIEVPLTGTATKQGIVTFAVKATDEAGAEKDFGSVSTIVRAGFDAQGEELPLLTQNFGKFPWGGDCIGQKAGVTTADRLTLKWNAVPDATSYTVAYWKGSASAPESEYAYKTGIASTATSQELTNLESNTSYWAKVKAVGSLDSDWSETANATTMDSGGEPLLPTADLLDVVFRNDGSAMDNSPSATPVRALEGTAMMTYYNDLYSRYAAHFNHTPGTSVNEGFYKADYSANKQFQDALADGHTLEALFKLDEKSDGSAELKMFSSMSSGGTGFLISKADKGTELTFLPNVSTTGKSNWIWTKSGINPEAGRYYHVVGVWNKQEAKTYIYVDGELKGTMDAPGNYVPPTTTTSYWFGIGVDASATVGQNAWKGDVAIARVYDAPLTAEKVKALWETVKRDQQPAAINITGLLYLSGCEVGADYTYTLYGKGFAAGDRIRFEPLAGSAGAFTLDGSAAAESLSVRIPNGFASGRYRMVLMRGQNQYPLGITQLTYSNNPARVAKPRVIAHRGYHKDGAAQNSVAALAKAQELGIYGSEFDVWITADGKVVINHDSTVPGSSLVIENVNYDQIKDLTLANGEKLPTLDDYLEQATKNADTKLILEIKRHSSAANNARAADAVIEAVKAKGLTDRVEYIAFDYTTCKRIVNALPGAMVQYLNGDLAPAAVRQDGIGGIDYRFSAYSGNPGWVKEAHANGMVTNVWTVDTVQDMMTCIAWGMDFITTNNPETLKELLTRTFVSAN